MNNERDPLNIEYSSDGQVVGIYGRRISDYWDHQHDQIVRMADVCAGLGSDSTLALQRSVLQLASALTPYWLAMSVFIMAEDVYRTAAKPTMWTDTIGAYLEATAKTLLAAAEERGFVLQYVIDNVPSDASSAGTRQQQYNQFVGSCLVYPTWFRSAGLPYVSPQEAAGVAMSAEGIDLRTFADRWPEFAADGRAASLEAVKRLQAAKQHFVYYDADWEPPSDAAISELVAAHVIGVFRRQAPILGSTCELILPAGLSEA